MLDLRDPLVLLWAVGWLPWLCATASFGSCDPPTEDDLAHRRRSMVREIQADVRATARETGRRRLNDRVIEALLQVPRHEFVPSEHLARAYDNRPLPIGAGQTISQPYIVAVMTDLLDPEPGDVVLEVGTGSGYQAAVLAQLVRRVYSVEIIPALGREAAERLRRLGYDNVEVRVGDGYQGWPEHAPYDAVIVTAAADELPPPLVEQLRPGGRLILPRGAEPYGQILILIEKTQAGELIERELLPVRFVPLTGEHR